jgi:hypothetical protein
VPLLWLDESLAPRLFGRSTTWLWRGSAGRPVTIDVALDTIPMPYPVRNVAAVLRGSDPALAREYVALGAHGDHLGADARPVDHDSLRIFDRLVRPGGMEDRDRQPTAVEQAAVNQRLAAWRAAHPGAARLDSIYNGADDDGSGAVALLEIAERLASMPVRPRRSVLFVWHAAEERGLWGSAYYADHPTVPRDAIVAHVGVDMLGHGDAWDVTGIAKDGRALHGAPNYLQLVGARRLSTELGDVVERVNGAGHGLVLDAAMDAPGHPAQYYCRSDHYSYARYGIPSVLFSTGGNADYHEVTDEPQYVDYEHLARATRFVADLVVRLADLDHRPRVDRARPDPRAPCRQ